MEKRQADLFIRFPFRGREHALCSELTFQASPERLEQYLNALKQDMRTSSAEFADLEIRSISVGGGSPTILQPQQLSALLKEVRSLFCVAENAQVTVETDVTDLTSSWMVHFQNMRVNRIMIELLTGRHSDYERYLLPGSIAGAQTALMLPQIFSIRDYAAVILYGLPGMRDRDFLVSTRFCCKYHAPEIIFRRFLPVNHALWQSLGQPPLPDEESAAAVTMRAREHLLEKGYQEYVPEHFALPGFIPIQALAEAEQLGFGPGTQTITKSRQYRTTGILRKYLQENEL